MIYIDTREKPDATKAIKAYFDSQGEPWRMKKLDVGDYCTDSRPDVVIDRKAGLNEVAQNLCSADRCRFWREARRAFKQNIRMIVLVEETGVKQLTDVADWHGRYSRVSGSRLMEEMFAIAAAYGVEWRFCRKRSAGHEILRILKEV